MLCGGAVTLPVSGQVTVKTPSKEHRAKVVRLIVDYGDGVEKHFTKLPYRAGMSVGDALQLARNHRRGIQVTLRGSGSTAFLSAIDGLSNEGNGKNWTYHVNGKMPDHSFAVHKIAAGDVILWRFGKYR